MGGTLGSTEAGSQVFSSELEFQLHYVRGRCGAACAGSAPRQHCLRLPPPRPQSYFRGCRAGGGRFPGRRVVLCRTAPTRAAVGPRHQSSRRGKSPQDHLGLLCGDPRDHLGPSSLWGAQDPLGPSSLRGPQGHLGPSSLRGPQDHLGPSSLRGPQLVLLLSHRGTPRPRAGRESGSELSAQTGLRPLRPARPPGMRASLGESPRRKALPASRIPTSVPGIRSRATVVCRAGDVPHGFRTADSFSLLQPLKTGVESCLLHTGWQKFRLGTLPGSRRSGVDSRPVLALKPRPDWTKLKPGAGHPIQFSHVGGRTPTTRAITC
ncbi:uncharacterized protein LOC133768183 [Lepus europaeus]|uniref:uncharacterized protein LOC133768183 n=1 Tax=Lepus europaeus TaxID=9983 RepID=UPI002B478AA9|nr:uncharacterized protein LOC133768183 [Lepus europaeus]